MVGSKINTADVSGADSLCYFLVCFREAEFVAFLLASLFREQDTFIIHCDKKAPKSLISYLHQLQIQYENIVLIPSHDYSWAGFSHVDLSLKAVDIALNISVQWTHLIFLSEQHLPLKSPSEIAVHLKRRKSIVAVRPVASMGGGEQADIENRFGGFYRELPGVGCFVIGTAARNPFTDNVYHGSNWMVLCRDHCAVLRQANRDGLFKHYESVVHAEEMAIHSILFPYIDEIECRDVVLVATPDITDNHNLVMSEDLYKKFINTDYLFIRKRTPVLSEFVKHFIVNNHFEKKIYYNNIDVFEEASLIKSDDDKIFLEFHRLITKNFTEDVTVKLIGRDIYGSVPRFYAVLGHVLLPENISVRVISENLCDFKVLILKSESYNGIFTRPYKTKNYIHSTIRSRTHELFGNEEILPLSAAAGGFVSIDNKNSIDLVSEVASEFLRNAIAFSNLSNVIPTRKSSKKKVGENMRAQRLNALAAICGAKRYLEVGVCNGDTFFEVDVSYKVAVDPNFLFQYELKTDEDTVFNSMTSDNFFETSSETPFDLIYLDGLHTYEQTTRDFLNSLRFAHDKTIWVLDDTVPHDVFSAIPDQQKCYELRHKFMPDDWFWMGDVYKTVFFIERMLPFFRFKTYSGHGQTVIWKSSKARTIADSKIGLHCIGTMSYVDFIDTIDVMCIDEEQKILDLIRLTFAS